MKKLFKNTTFALITMIFVMFTFNSCKEIETDNSIDQVLIEPELPKFDLEKETLKLDSINSEIKKLSSFYYTEKDEFKGINWYKPKSEKSTYGNTVYSYFGVDDSKNVFIPRIVIRYYGEDWIFWDKAAFLVDGTPFNFVPGQKPSHNNNSSVWESSDDELSDFFKSEFLKMAEAKEVKYRLSGKYYKDFKLSKKQINSIVSIINLNDLILQKTNIEKGIEINKK